MKIKILKFTLSFLALIAIIYSCNNDDDNIITVEERDRTEQQAADRDSLLAYLSTHYYNSSFLEADTNRKYSDIIITELITGDEVPEGNRLLIDAVETHTINYLDVEYEYYILRLNQGGGNAPRFTDAVRVRYEGVSVESGETFDIISTPEDFSLTTSIGLGVIKGWELIMPQFNSAIVPTDGYNVIEGIVQYDNFGLGVMFIPSGLAYYSGANTGSSYDNLIFKFELLQVEQADHEGDGIPSYLEDLDGDNDVFNEDTDDDGFANFIDVDDDGDGVLTVDENQTRSQSGFINLLAAETYVSENLLTNELLIDIVEEENGTFTVNVYIITDANDDGMADYLDSEITTNYNEIEN